MVNGGGGGGGAAMVSGISASNGTASQEDEKNGKWRNFIDARLYLVQKIIRH
jgi:hypothetical protein